MTPHGITMQFKPCHFFHFMTNTDKKKTNNKCKKNAALKQLKTDRYV